jgi:hypothetical protein
MTRRGLFKLLFVAPLAALLPKPLRISATSGYAGLTYKGLPIVESRYAAPYKFGFTGFKPAGIATKGQIMYTGNYYVSNQKAFLARQRG